MFKEIMAENFYNFLNKFKQHFPQDSAFSHLGIPKRNQKVFPPTDKYLNIYDSFIHNIHKLETTKMSINW